MKKGSSGQVLALTRLLSLHNESRATNGHTLDEIASWPPIARRRVQRDSIGTAFRRFDKLGITQSHIDTQTGIRHYRIKNADWARAYIEGDKDKPWLPLTPTPPSGFTDLDEHKDHFDIIAPREVIDRLKALGQRSSGQLTYRADEFTISINESSGRGQVYIKAYWRTAIKTVLGAPFYDYLHALEMKGAMRGDFCLPVGMKGQRFTIGGRPVQWSASHYPAQLDVQCSKDDNVRRGLEAITDQADFNTRMLDHLDAVLSSLERQGETIEKIARNLVTLAEHIKGSDGGPYTAPPPDPEDKAYG